jgi:aspartate carbamoyltransferase catalytic subunit
LESYFYFSVGLEIVKVSLMKIIGSILDLRGFDSQKFNLLFQAVKTIRQSQSSQSSSVQSFSGKTVALLFFEPSTRTRMSFESAAFRCGFGPLIFDGGINTSLEKGETVEDSILNIAAMNPGAVVVRCGDSVNLPELAKQMNVPLINAGWGIKGHPTQALLDAVTIQHNLGSLSGKKLLMVGDIKHSRVAASHLELMPQLGVEVGLCGPADFMPADQILSNGKKIHHFSELSKALAWADVAMALRVQFERHSGKLTLTREQYFAEYGLTMDKLNNLNPQGLVMHPGPINYGIEMASEVLTDPRTKVLEQVTTGVYVREAILKGILNGK